MSKYDVILDLTDVNDSRSLALARVPHRSRVLDIGIGDGTMARTLSGFGCHVWGVERDKELVEASLDDYEGLVHADVEDIDFSCEFPGRRFDVILMLDVLEHLREPTAVLSRSRDVLDDHGFVIVSVPNVAHAAVKLQLLDGKFSYTDTGLLDDTHVRFFDFDNVQSLVGEAGLAMFDLVRVTREPDETEIAVDLARVPEDVLRAVTEAPESRTYQFVFCAAPLRSPVIESPPPSQAAVLQREVLRLRDELIESRRQLQDELSEARRQLVEASMPVLSRAWLSRETIDWVDEMLAEVRAREMNHQHALKDIVAHFESTMREVRQLLDENA